MSRVKTSKELYELAKIKEKEVDALKKEAHKLHLEEQRKRPLLDRLCFAAYSRCECGAGMAYDPASDAGLNGQWECSDILLGRAIPKGQEGSRIHSNPLPFAFYEVKSENQPSANGATTRPKE